MVDFIDINVIIRTDNPNEIGFGYVTSSCCEDYDCSSNMYQSRVNPRNKNDDDIIEELSEGKMYVGEHSNPKDAIGEILNFWGIAVPDAFEIWVFDSIQDAMYALGDSKFIIYCQVK